jgi:SagB-type dehydrogenase family enzyme
MTRSIVSLVTFALVSLQSPLAPWAAPPASVQLPKPRTSGGKPLLDALAARRSTREFSPQALPQQELSNLLWAAQGVNRPATGHRTAPTARHWCEIDVYVAMAGGVFVFEPVGHRLRRVLDRDVRAATGVQPYVKTAAVNLIYVADLSRMRGASAADQVLYSATDAGFIAQNVYLYCAAAGLACVVRGAVDRASLGKVLGLGATQKVILSQSIGYPTR